MTDTSFCTRCGERVSEEALYCPSCGCPIEGRVDPKLDGMSVQQFMEKEIIDSKVKFNTMLLLIYGIPVILMGIYMLFRLDQLTSILLADSMVQEAMVQYSLTSADITAALKYMGILITVSGSLALVAAYCVYNRKFWIVAVICTATASVLFTMSIFGLLIGLLVTWSIIGLKPYFDVGVEPPAAE